VIAMETPIGFIPLQEAVRMVGQKMGGGADIERAIAEGCETGEIAAAYRAWTCGADELDPAVWRLPHWRNYFAKGMIDLVLPLVDERGRPNQFGHTSRCTCEVFVRRDSMDRFIKTLAPPVVAAARYPGDTALIEEGLILLANGMTDRAAARQLAPRAEGPGILESKVDRLRTKLSEERKRRSNPAST
jgi:hypothetical protein